ncbi:uncharacterized protein LOC131271806 isoform X1 [Anopheles coustani]|uniref:uncharacterized protein LOC131271806 isoform X1 n=1 Tax=Anopheles coustani TaxID=139045 RepID=UPI00265ABF83|nr:uncharacterized protein LOC131271806 isoform X1 [Anopheles coustani]
MFTCQCLNVSITVNDESFLNITHPVQETLKSDPNVPRRPVPPGTAAGGGGTTGIVDGKSRELACFFQEAIGPLPEANVSVQLTTLLKPLLCERWEVSKCLNCSCLVFARDPLGNPTALLVNPSLATTAEAIAQRMAQENYSPAYRIMLDGRAADFRGFYRKDEYRSLFNAAANTLDSTNDSNELLEQLRAFMRAETQLANERIARFTQELNEQLCNMRDRAEQDYLFLAQSFVPELEANKSGDAAVPPTTTTTTTIGNAVKMPTMVRSTSGGDRRMEEGGDEKAVVGGGPVPAKALAQLMTNVTTTAGAGGVSDSQPGSQMETPPPTPECMPMSTGNSPPSMVHGGSSGGGGGSVVGSSTESSAMSTGEVKSQRVEQNSRTSSISSNSFALDGQEATNGGSGALRSQSIAAGMRPALSNSVANTINNNTTTNRGAINKPPTQQQQQQHSSSTNLFANQNSGLTGSSPGMPGNVGGLMGAHRFSSNSGGNNHALDADCLFDIDGMENDKTPPPDTYSDEDECDYDDTTDNNNQEGGMRIPRMPYRQNSSIARSLPISTPKPMTPFRGNDDDLDEMTEEAVDIAASIKAIAKSVHGDAVFGDLPRRQIQKFTSQI